MEFDKGSAEFGRGRRTKTWIVAGTVVGVVVVLGGAFTIVAKPFASGKQLMLNGLSAANIGSTTSNKGPIEEKMTLSLSNLQAPALSGTQGALLKTLNGSTIDLDMLFDPSQKHAEVDFDTQYQSVAHHGAVWVSSDQAILSASDYQSLLASVLPPGESLPKYLVTGSSQGQAIAKFWSSMNMSTQKMTKAQQDSVLSLEKVLVNGIPSQYIHRSGLNSIQIKFNQSGLQDILKSEVQAIYAHKQEVADGVNALAQVSEANSASGNAAASSASLQNLSSTVMNMLNRMPEEAAMAAVSTALNAGVVTVDTTTFTITKPLFGKGLSDSFDGGIGIHAPNLSLDLGYTVSATKASKAFQPPKVDSSDSETFQQWASMGQAQTY